MHAHNKCRQMKQAIVDAERQLVDLQENGKLKEQQRLDELLNEPDNLRLQSARVMNVYTATKREVQHTREIIAARELELEDANKQLKFKQQELAQKLQESERTRKLRDHLVHNLELEEMRRA